MSKCRGLCCCQYAFVGDRKPYSLGASFATTALHYHSNRLGSYFMGSLRSFVFHQGWAPHTVHCERISNKLRYRTSGLCFRVFWGLYVYMYMSPLLLIPIQHPWKSKGHSLCLSTKAFDLLITTLNLFGKIQKTSKVLTIIMGFK